MRNAATQVVYDLAKNDRNVIAVTADNRNEIYNKIRLEIRNQYIDYGIAEENMIASAGGLASCGKTPFIYTITNFMSMHAFEFIRNDVCIGNQNVKFLGRSAGLVSSSMGATHQGTEELAILRCLPNLLVITPATPIEAREATKFAYKHKGPVYIRLEGFNEPELFNDNYIFTPGKGNIIREGSDITVIAMGSIINLAIQVASSFAAEHIEVRIIDMPTLLPIDKQLILNAAKETKGIVTLEEHSIYGGLGSAVAEVLAENCISTKFARMGLHGCAIGCGNRDEIRELNGIGENDVKKKLREMLG